MHVLKYPLGPLSWSIATPDGAPAKTAKATLFHILEGKAEDTEVVPSSAVWILNQMDLLQTMKSAPQDIQRTSQLRASLGEIDLIPAQLTSWISNLKCL